MFSPPEIKLIRLGSLILALQILVGAICSWLLLPTAPSWMASIRIALLIIIGMPVVAILVWLLSSSMAVPHSIRLVRVLLVVILVLFVTGGWSREAYFITRAAWLNRVAPATIGTILLILAFLVYPRLAAIESQRPSENTEKPKMNTAAVFARFLFFLALASCALLMWILAISA